MGTIATADRWPSRLDRSFARPHVIIATTTATATAVSATFSLVTQGSCTASTTLATTLPA